MSSPDDTHGPARDLGEAFRWLQQVDGRLLCRSEAPESRDGWVAVVKTPAATGRGAQVILGFGDSALSALETAHESWQRAWREISSIH